MADPAEKPLWQHQEEWAEREAKFCDQMVEEYNRMAREWADKSVHPESMKMALECSISAQVWRQVSWSLRKPKNCRIEQAQLKGEV